MPDRSRIIVEGQSPFVFLRLGGQPQPSGLVLEPFDRPGTDGLSFQAIGRRGVPFRLIGLRDFDTMLDAVDALASLQDAIQGKVCTVVDSSGVEHADMVCLAVRPGEPRPVLAAVGGISSQFGAIAEVEMDFVARD